MPAQLGAHAQRSLPSRGMVGHEILRVALIVQQFLGAQRIDQRRNDRPIVTLIEQLTAQILGGVVAAGERVERRYTRRPCIERLELLAPQGITPL